MKIDRFGFELRASRLTVQTECMLQAKQLVVALSTLNFTVLIYLICIDTLNLT